MSEAERSVTVSLAERRIQSPLFKTIYDEGMGLVEQAAAYLDGPGRAAAKGLNREVATLYAAESMRLTTRLMQIASWLLLQRAANSGEMTYDQVSTEKSKVRLDTGSARGDAPMFSCLPADFQDLVDRSLSLQGRVYRMDEEIYGDAPVQRANDNPVSEQIMLLKTAFAS